MRTAFMIAFFFAFFAGCSGPEPGPAESMECLYKIGDSLMGKSHVAIDEIVRDHELVSRYRSESILKTATGYRTVFDLQNRRLDLLHRISVTYHITSLSSAETAACLINAAARNSQKITEPFSRQRSEARKCDHGTFPETEISAFHQALALKIPGRICPV